jgi:hypothetical protein
MRDLQLVPCRTRAGSQLLSGRRIKVVTNLTILLFGRATKWRRALGTPYVETATLDPGLENMLPFHTTLPRRFQVNLKMNSGIHWHAFTKAHSPGSIQTKGARETDIQLWREGATWKLTKM